MKKLLTSLILLSIMSLTLISCEEKSKPIGPLVTFTRELPIYKKSDMDPRLKRHPQAVMMYEEAGSSPASAFDLGNFYKNDLKDYQEAIVWYTRAYEKGYKKAANNMASAYVDLVDYDNAVKWYKISISKGNEKSYFNLAYVYDKYLKDKTNAIKYYDLDIMKNFNKDAITNLGLLYAKEKEYIKSAAYFFNLITYYTKKETVLKYLRDDLKYSEETIKKGYELQLTMPGLHDRYKGGI